LQDKTLNNEKKNRKFLINKVELFSQKKMISKKLKQIKGNYNYNSSMIKWLVATIILKRKHTIKLNNDIFFNSFPKKIANTLLIFFLFLSICFEKNYLYFLD
jgi:hypothetical protein